MQYINEVYNCPVKLFVGMTYSMYSKVITLPDIFI